jgi:hypothetical protein
MMAERPESAAATPTIIAATETMPSFAPSTAARSHPVRCPRCRSAARAGLDVLAESVTGRLHH